MNWFGRKKEARIQLPFPPERIAVISSVLIPAAIERATRLRQKLGIDRETVWASSFLNSYICSYCKKLDEHNPQIGASVRFSVLRTTLAKSEAEAQFRFDAFCASMNARDPETMDAFQLGSADGAAYSMLSSIIKMLMIVRQQISSSRFVR